MRQLARAATERVVYGFLGWFESFNSVWQTTLIIFGLWGAELLDPRLDQGHLVFLLVLSLYATFTQNGLAHENKLTADKLDVALETIDRVVDESYAASQALLQLGENQTGIQEALVAQADVIVAQTNIIATAVGGHSEELDMLVELARRTEEIAARTSENERAQTELLQSRSELFSRLDSTVAELARGLAEDAERRRTLAIRISDIGRETPPPPKEP